MQASLTDCMHGPDAIYDGRVDARRAHPRVTDKRYGVILADRKGGFLMERGHRQRLVCPRTTAIASSAHAEA
jgi:hypothetical protein